MKKVLLVFFVALLCTLMTAQPPFKFATSFGSTGVETAYSVKELSGKRFAVVGSTSSYDAKGTDIILLMVDSMGNRIWQKLFGGTGLDVGRSVVIHPMDSSFIIAGFSSSSPSGGYDAYCLRLDKTGAVIWEKFLGGQDWDFGYDLAILPGGDIVIAGKTYSETYGKSDGFIAKLNMLNGSVIWTKKYGGAGEDGFCSLVAGSNGTIYVAGNYGSNTDQLSKFWCQAINTNGDSIFSKVYGHTGKVDVCYDLMEDKKQNLILCGSYDYSVLHSDSTISYIEKIDLLGNSIAQSTLSGAGRHDRMLAVTNRKGTNDYCFSRSVLYGSQLTNTQPILFIDDFTFLQATTYGGFGWDETFDIISTSDRGYVMVGYTKSYNASFNEDIYFVKLDSTFLNAQVITSLHDLQSIPSKPVLSVSVFSDKIKVQGLTLDQLEYDLFKIDGTLVMSGKENSPEIPLESVLAPGIYILQLKGEPIRLKFLVQ